MWAELSELFLVAILWYGCEKERQLTTFVAPCGAFRSVILLCLFMPVSYPFCKCVDWFLFVLVRVVWGCFYCFLAFFFLILFIMNLNSYKKRQNCIRVFSKATYAVFLEEGGRALCRKEWKKNFDISKGYNQQSGMK